jgi:hypothetical protein
MITSPYEDFWTPQLYKLADELNAKIGAAVVVINTGALPVVEPALLDKLADENEDWFLAGEAYKKIYGHFPPTTGHAIRFGKQMSARFPITRWYGPQRKYWVASAGVFPIGR